MGTQNFVHTGKHVSDYHYTQAFSSIPQRAWNVAVVADEASELYYCSVDYEF